MYIVSNNSATKFYKINSDYSYSWTNNLNEAERFQFELDAKIYANCAKSLNNSIEAIIIPNM